MTNTHPITGRLVATHGRSRAACGRFADADSTTQDRVIDELLEQGRRRIRMVEAVGVLRGPAAAFALVRDRIAAAKTDDDTDNWRRALGSFVESAQAAGVSIAGATATLVALLDDTDERVVDAAVRALGALADPSVLPALLARAPKIVWMREGPRALARVGRNDRRVHELLLDALATPRRADHERAVVIDGVKLLSPSATNEAKLSALQKKAREPWLIARLSEALAASGHDIHEVVDDLVRLAERESAKLPPPSPTADDGYAPPTSMISLCSLGLPGIEAVAALAARRSRAQVHAQECLASMSYDLTSKAVDVFGVLTDEEQVKVLVEMAGSAGLMKQNRERLLALVGRARAATLLWDAYRAAFANDPNDEETLGLASSVCELCAAAPLKGVTPWLLQIVDEVWASARADANVEDVLVAALAALVAQRDPAAQAPLSARGAALLDVPLGRAALDASHG